MENVKIKFDYEPLLWHLTKNEGATIALAKAQLSVRDFEIFLVEAQIQQVHSWFELAELFPDLFGDLDEVMKSSEESIAKLKIKRDDLKKSA